MSTPITRNIRSLLAALAEADWESADITVDDVRLRVARGTPLQVEPVASPPLPAELPPAPTSAPTPSPDQTLPPTQQPPTGAAADGIVVAAPSVGSFWRAPEPGAAPFVEIGDLVAEGDTLGIVEVMKLMQHVSAPAAGSIGAIHVGNGDAVDAGTPLITILAADDSRGSGAR